MPLNALLNVLPAVPIAAPFDMMPSLPVTGGAARAVRAPAGRYEPPLQLTLKESRLDLERL